MDEAAATGLPVIRHPFIEYPADADFYTMTYQQFMIGSEFMVAPVLDPGVTRVSVSLPAGRWVHVWTGQTYGSASTGDGTRISIDAPIGQPAIFYREGSPQGQLFVQNLRQAGLLE